MESAYKGYEGIVFPIYRINKMGNAIVRIDSPDSFEEIQKIGEKRWKHTINAQAYPEKVLIHDMVHLSHPMWDESDAETYDKWTANLS